MVKRTDSADVCEGLFSLVYGALLPAGNSLVTRYLSGQWTGNQRGRGLESI